MIIDEERFRINISQAKTGSFHVWIVKDLEIKADNTTDLTDALNDAISRINPILKKLNGE
tara:strand:- start:277 stop:456 length:180 start_codon:yes stop_codon:yes gene_type:complete